MNILKNIYTFPKPSSIFTEDFSGSGNGTITNLGSSNGFILSVSGGTVNFTAAHTAAVNQPVADNHWIYNTTYSNNIFSVIFNLGFTVPTNNQTQYEAGIWWDSNNRIYVGNDATDTGSFFSIKTGGVDQIITSGFSQNTSAFFQIILDRTNNLCTFYRANPSGCYEVMSQNVDTSAMSIPNTNWTVFFGGGNEKSGRTGGATGFMSFINAYESYNNINPTTL